ncbi:MAG: dienelactone hydrolase family protein [Nakamurella sp.]
MTDLDLTSQSAARGGSQPLHAYLAQPAGDGPWPGMVVVHEIFGLDDEARKHTDRIAAMGYLAVAVDLYSQGGTRRCLSTTMKSLSSGTGRPFIDIEVGRQWLLDNEQCSGRVGVIGFCMGGGFALIAATSGFDVSSVNYGKLPDKLDEVVADGCPIVGSYGAKDRSLKGAAPKLEAALQKAGVEHDVKEYPSASHAFLNEKPSGPVLLRPLLRVMGMGPEPIAAADAWRRIETFLGAHLR